MVGYVSGRLVLRLIKEGHMRPPGEACLEWRVTTSSRGTRLTQCARFKPRELLGRVYLYLVAPFHGLVFPGLVRRIIADAHAA